MLQDYNPWSLPWLSIVNLPLRNSSPGEIAAINHKIKDHYRDYGADSLSVVLEQGVRLDKARPDLLIAVVSATMPYSREIKGWEQFKAGVEKSLTVRGYKNLIG